MRNGTHEDTLKAAVSKAEQVIWYRPTNARWDMADKLAGPGVLITDSIDDIVEQALAIIQTPGVWHILIMSNSSFGGLYPKLLARLPNTETQ